MSEREDLLNKIREEIRLKKMYLTNPNYRKGFNIAHSNEAEKMVFEYPGDDERPPRTFVLSEHPKDWEKERAIQLERDAYADSLPPGSTARVTILDKQGFVLYFSGDAKKRAKRP